MGVGHLAVGFASKRLAPRTQLAWLMLAPIFIDLLWGVFIFTGVERAKITPGITKSIPLDLEYLPISHSLVAVIGWSALVAAIYFVLKKDWRAAAVLAAGVFSHWVLDWIAHRPDMPILPSGPKVGLGLWNYPLPSFCVEAAMLALGAWIYVGSTRPRTSSGKIGLAILLVVLFAFNAGAYFGTPPNDVRFMAGGNLAMIILLWAVYRIDRSREPI